jgi:hypothetical protein
VKNAVVNYEATIRELNAYVAKQAQGQLFDDVDELMLRIIKIMLINEIASTENVSIPNTAENIQFGLDYVSPEEKRQIEDRLSLLASQMCYTSTKMSMNLFQAAVRMSID